MTNWRRLIAQLSLRAFFQLFIVASLLGIAGKGNASPISTAVSKYRTGELGLKIIELPSRQPVFQSSSNSPMKPASVMKLATSYTALDKLGPEYQFTTDLYGSVSSNGEIPTLYVVGGGDPTLTTESVWVIARALKRRGVKKVGRLSLDSFYFLDPKRRKGQRAYEAGSSALSFNYNSLLFELCPGSSGSNVNIGIDPWEYPTELRGAITSTSKGYNSYRIDEQSKLSGERTPVYNLKGNLRTNSKGKCLPVYRSVDDPVKYFASVFRGHLESVGIQVGEGMQRKGYDGSGQLLYSHRSKPLAQIVHSLNHYSNNFIAEQLVGILDPKKELKERTKGLREIGITLERLGISPSSISVIDGSGLSHSNRLSAAGLVTLLEAAYENEKIWPEFVTSLSIGGKTGTLKDRQLGGGTVRAKTGTLDGVTSLAGYLWGKGDKLYAFAILQNGVRSKAKAHQLERKVLTALAAL